VCEAARRAWRGGRGSAAAVSAGHVGREQAPREPDRSGDGVAAPICARMCTYIVVRYHARTHTQTPAHAHARCVHTSRAHTTDAHAHTDADCIVGALEGGEARGDCHTLSSRSLAHKHLLALGFRGYAGLAENHLLHFALAHFRKDRTSETGRQLSYRLRGVLSQSDRLWGCTPEGWSRRHRGWGGLGERDRQGMFSSLMIDLFIALYSRHASATYLPSLSGIIYTAGIARCLAAARREARRPTFKREQSRNPVPIDALP
jgi:hypothetical protein